MSTQERTTRRVKYSNTNHEAVESALNELLDDADRDFVLTKARKLARHIDEYDEFDRIDVSASLVGRSFQSMRIGEYDTPLELERWSTGKPVVWKVSR